MVFFCSKARRQKTLSALNPKPRPLPHIQALQLLKDESANFCRDCQLQRHYVDMDLGLGKVGVGVEISPRIVSKLESRGWGG